MINSAEERVSRFYSESGWGLQEEVAKDTELFEDLRECAKEYVSKTRLRILRHIPAQGQAIIDMASGSIPFKEYLAFSENFAKRYCIDLSPKAIAEARKKIGDHGEFFTGSFFDFAAEENFFDCAISLHTIYHIDKDKQEEAVRKLLAITKSGRPVIIVYSNPSLFAKLLTTPTRVQAKIRSWLSTPEERDAESIDLYFFDHPNNWWKRFEDVAEVEMRPWRSFGTGSQKFYFPNNALGKKMFTILFNLEERFPNFFVRFFQYPMIILTKS